MKQNEQELLNLAVRISGLKAKASSEDPNSSLSSTTDSEGTYNEESFEKFLDQQDHNARSKLMSRSRSRESRSGVGVAVRLENAMIQGRNRTFENARSRSRI